MKKLKLVSENTKLTDIANLIVKEKIRKLKKRIGNVNQVVNIANRSNTTPLIFALSLEKYKVVKWLVESGARLNDRSAPLIMAVRNCSVEMIDYLLDNGANIHIRGTNNITVMSSALYGERYELIEYLVEKGYKILRDGTCLRQAVHNNQLPAIKTFLDLGVDVNYFVPSMVFPNNPSPVHVAALANNIELVKLLVENGADISLPDKHGDTPYKIAFRGKNFEIIKYLDMVKGNKIVNIEDKIAELSEYNFPKQLIELMKIKNVDKRTINIDFKYSKFLVFEYLPFIRTYEYKRKKYVDLLEKVDNYSEYGFIAWAPHKNKLSHIDFEHDTVKDLGTLEKFIENPSQVINKIFK